MSTRVVHVNDNVPGAVYIGRRNNRYRLAASPLANPYRVQDGGRRLAVSQYRHWLELEIHWPNPDVINALIACRTAPAVACWCRHDGEVMTASNLCHGDVIVNMLERYTDDELRAMAHHMDPA